MGAALQGPRAPSEVLQALLAQLAQLEELAVQVLLVLEGFLALPHIVGLPVPRVIQVIWVKQALLVIQGKLV
jgi:hypothetical protein